MPLEDAKTHKGWQKFAKLFESIVIDDDIWENGIDNDQASLCFYWNVFLAGYGEGHEHGFADGCDSMPPNG